MDHETPCPLCAPRPESSEHGEFVARLDTASLYLNRNQTWRGHCVLVLDLRHATRATELAREEWLRLCTDLHRAQQAVEAVVNPDHVNVASLGNVVRHLHWHIIPRYRDDPRWGAAIWTTDARDMPDRRLADGELETLRAQLRQAIAP